ncbi:hypothetical protein [Microbacterium plantarum]|uniref:hypothetical protein n=1 Tax=Microbacterium plantarum TaxID=1816425 RepID=UPI002B4745AE|nr:hypothetical protein [Microbacterium plantarum]WRK16926.1 hypothetical protein VC184_13595 [Microbacterium plantarum]
MSAAVVIMTGVATATALNRRDPVARPAKLSWTAPRAHPVVLALTALPLVYSVATVGIEPFVRRASYLFGEQGSFASSVVTQLTTLVIVVLGYIVARASGGTRFVAILILLGYVLMIGSYGSRRFALIPVLFALGVFLAGNTRWARWGLLLGAVVTFLLLPLPLDFRSSPTHGIAPYTSILMSHDWFRADYLSALNNIFISFPIIGQSAYGGAPVGWGDIAVSLNPIPGDAAGFYDISQRLRLNAYTPMAGIGELGNVGWDAVVIILGGVGVLLGYFENIIRRGVVDGRLLYAGLIMGFVVLFALQMTQYNLRLASRLLVYLMVVELVRRGLALLARSQRTGLRNGRAGRGLTSTPRAG